MCRACDWGSHGVPPPDTKSDRAEGTVGAPPFRIPRPSPLFSPLLSQLMGAPAPQTEGDSNRTSLGESDWLSPGQCLSWSNPLGPRQAGHTQRVLYLMLLDGSRTQEVGSLSGQVNVPKRHLFPSFSLYFP